MLDHQEALLVQKVHLATEGYNTLALKSFSYPLVMTDIAIENDHL
jgi:hypothetical protein